MAEIIKINRDKPEASDALDLYRHRDWLTHEEAARLADLGFQVSYSRSQGWHMWRAA